MANPDYSQVGRMVEPPSASVISATMGWVGAGCSLALLAGLGLWTYDLAKRDAYGVPVIAAIEGPARVAPEQPGGFQAAHQGLAVNDISSRADDVPTEQVSLAPPPTPLAPTDQPTTALQPQARESGLRDAINNALQDAGVLPEAANGTTAAQPAAGLVGVPRPKPRPDMGVVSRAVSTAAILPTRALDLEPGDIPAGTRLVQLGAYDTAETARAEWDRAADRFGPFMEEKQRVIERTERGGKVLYRLRVHGFADLPDARRFCAALEAEKADCIPVLVR